MAREKDGEGQEINNKGGEGEDAETQRCMEGGPSAWKGKERGREGGGSGGWCRKTAMTPAHRATTVIELFLSASVIRRSFSLSNMNSSWHKTNRDKCQVSYTEPYCRAASGVVGVVGAPEYWVGGFEIPTLFFISGKTISLPMMGGTSLSWLK